MAANKSGTAQLCVNDCVILRKLGRLSKYASSNESKYRTSGEV
jgi:hypothetical protein